MKRLFAILIFVLTCAGCDKSGTSVSPTIHFDPDQKDIVLVPGIGATYDVKFTSSSSWTVDFLYADNIDGWTTVSDTCGKGGYEINKLNFVIEKNRSGYRRTVWLIINSGMQSKNILFTQGPYVSGLDEEDENEGSVPGGDIPSVPSFGLSDRYAYLDAAGGTVRIEVPGDLGYECHVPVDWVRQIKTSADDDRIHTFEVYPNEGTETRYCTLSFCGNGMCIPFTITQTGVEKSL